MVVAHPPSETIFILGWMFASAAQLGVPNLLLEHKAKDVNGLDGKMHPLHGGLQEGSIEEVLNRGSMCYLAVHPDDLFYSG